MYMYVCIYIIYSRCTCFDKHKGMPATTLELKSATRPALLSVSAMAFSAHVQTWRHVFVFTYNWQPSPISSQE